MSDNLDKLREETEAKKLKFQSNLYSTVNSAYEVKDKIKEDWNNDGVSKKTFNVIKWLVIVGIIYTIAVYATDYVKF